MRGLFVVILLVSLPIASLAGLPTSAAREERILFIGNSLTFSNGLPRMVQDVATHGTGIVVRCDSVAFPNFALEDHLADGRAERALMNGRWTAVVMQQGPSAGAEGRRSLRAYAKRFAVLARARGARPVLFTVWPSRGRYFDMDRVIESHALAAQDAGGEVVPVGVAWRAALQQDPTLPLYGRDGFHPSSAGTYLAALVFREWISGQASTGFTASWPGARKLALSPSQVALIEESAHLAITSAAPAR